MKLKFLFYIFGGILIIVLVAFLPLVFGFAKTGQNTTVLSKDYSLLNKTQIITRLQSDFPLPESIVLEKDNRRFTVPLSTISASINYSQTTNDLLFRRLNHGLVNYFQAFFRPKNFNLEVVYSDDQLKQYLTNSIASQIDHPFIPSEVGLDNQGKPYIKDGQIGEKTDVDSLAQDIVNHLKNYQLSPIKVPTNADGSLPSDSDKQAALDRAQKLLNKTLTLNGDTNPVKLAASDLVPWIGFNTDCAVDKISHYSQTLKDSVKKDPQDAVFKFENNKVSEFRPSVNGQYLDDQKFSQQICGQISELIGSTATELAYQLPLVPVEPQIKNDEVNNLGIKELIGRGTSSFSHSDTTRNYNVQKGSSIVNNILVAPGDTFSFLKNLGNVDLVNGFKQAYVIRQGKTELDVGGGICQVSTTLFRAILNAGLPVVQRQNHAYRVSYYEEDSKPGFDATVFIPSPDLQFVNDTGHYILIQSEYDGTHKKLAYDIYGTSDGRTVEISNYHQWDAAPPPPAVYIDDPTLPAGKTVQDEHAIPGLKTAFDWKVMHDGQTLHQKTFTSVYTPWAAVYRRGPQTQ